MADLPGAVLWDMDGTLVDTEPCWIDAEYALAERWGGRWSDDHALELVGNDLLASGRYIREHMGIDRTPEQIVDELLDGVIARVEREVPWRPGARELLQRLRDRDVPCALVTMSYERFASPILAELPSGTFDVVVTGDRVRRGKPDPEPYLQAAGELGVDPAACVVLEDSDTGARSAVAAGCGVVVVPCHVEVPPGPGRTFRDSLVELAPEDLLEVVGESRVRG